jgi:CRISPR-associated protein Cas1
VNWTGRDYDAEDWDSADLPNRCLSAATACLYGVTEAAVLAAGYAPAVGFIHTGKPLSFVYDVADVYKFETVVPVAFKVAAQAAGQSRAGGAPGLPRCFRQTRLLDRIIPDIEEILAAGEIAPPEALPMPWGRPAQPTEPRRCWSSCLRTRHPGCAAGWPCGCWKCAPASTWATTAAGA